MNKSSRDGNLLSNPLANLTHWYNELHRKYLCAQIDCNFKDYLLPQLQHALTEYESIEAKVYNSSPEDDLQNLLIRLRSINILLEGYYWIGAIETGKNVLANYSEVETWINNVAEGIKNGSFKKLEDMLSDLAGLSFLQHAKSVILRRSNRKRKQHYFDNKRRVLCEMTRIGINIATIDNYTKHKYREAISILDACDTLISFILSQSVSEAPNTGKLYGLRAQVLYFSGCCYRQINYLQKAEELFTECLTLYVKRINEKYSHYISGCEKPNWERFHLSAGVSRYRTAIILAVRADLNYRKGLRSIALHQNLGVAQIILGESEDVINRAYVRMQSAIISRELAKQEEDINGALLNIKKSQSDFEEMEHHKYAYRAKYEQANTLFYLARFYHKKEEGKVEKTAEVINEALQILASLRETADPRWKAQYLTLESRILVLKRDEKDPTKHSKEAESKATQAIKLLEEEPNHTTYLIEALIAKSRALMERFTQLERKEDKLDLLEEADGLLHRAWVANQNIQDQTPSNYKIEAIIHFARARVKFRMGQSIEAREQLREGKRFSPQIESEGVDQLRIYAEREIEGLGGVFIIPHDLDIGANKKALESFLIEQAKIRAKELGKPAWEFLKISKSSYFDKTSSKKTESSEKLPQPKSTKKRASKKKKTQPNKKS